MATPSRSTTRLAPCRGRSSGSLLPAVCRLSLCGAALLCGFAGVAQGQVAENDWRESARLMSRSTVTVRIWRAAAEPPAKPAGVEDEPEGGPQVTVLSGVCVAPGRVITASAAGSDSQIRLTLPGGEQIEASLRVVDDYSGLSLLSCKSAALVPVHLGNDDTPEAGSGVLSASAWGVEKPLVSVGVVAASGRTLRGTLLPPLLQCDVRTSETSSGSGVADRAGNLLGVVIAADHPDARSGWVYAVPVSHVRRILRIDQERAAGPAAQAGVVVLKRRRPLVGMVLEGAEEQVAVQRITPDGPAAKAGLQVGDRVMSVEGVLIRSVYQAVLPTLHRQPGDVVRFGVERNGIPQNVDVVLGGGVELPAPSQELLGQLLSPRLQVGRDGAGNYYAQPSQGHLREVFAPSLPAEEPQPRGGPAEKLSLLEKALDRYRQVIELQQKELRQREQEVQALQSELSRLKQQK